MGAVCSSTVRRTAIDIIPDRTVMIEIVDQIKAFEGSDGRLQLIRDLPHSHDTPGWNTSHLAALCFAAPNPDRPCISFSISSYGRNQIPREATRREFSPTHRRPLSGRGHPTGHRCFTGTTCGCPQEHRSPPKSEALQREVTCGGGD